MPPSGADLPLSAVGASSFDVVGTKGDGRSGVAAEARRVGVMSGVDAVWERLAEAWRALYMPSMNRVRSGELPWTNFDQLHRLSLDQVLHDVGAEGFDAAARDELTRAWERLPPWPDSVQGLERLGQRFTVSTLSNGKRDQQMALARFAGLPFERLLSAEGFHHYQPDPEVYLGAASPLGLQTGQGMDVGGHKADPRPAQ